MKRIMNKSSLLLFCIAIAVSSCMAKPDEKRKREVVKAETQKDEVNETEQPAAKPILIIGTASILYKFWFAKPSE